MKNSSRRTSWALAWLLALSSPLWGKEEGKAEPSAAIEYLPLIPQLIVNLAGRHHYLRANVQLMIQGKEALERIQPYVPVVRHTLITLFSNLPPEQLSDVGEREKLRQEALSQVRKALAQYTDSDGIKDLLFTEFLVQ
ncbi:hypothetical protein JCM13664_16540 [Methylothermus subterraneus]